MNTISNSPWWPHLPPRTTTEAGDCNVPFFNAVLWSVEIPRFRSGILCPTAGTVKLVLTGRGRSFETKRVSPCVDRAQYVVLITHGKTRTCRLLKANVLTNVVPGRSRWGLSLINCVPIGHRGSSVPLVPLAHGAIIRWHLPCDCDQVKGFIHRS